MTKLLTKNAKIAKSANDKYEIYNYGIPAYQSNTGLKTCPMAGECKEGCYATMGAYAWSNVQQAYEWRLAQSLRDDFTEVMSLQIETKHRRVSKKGKQLVIRVHDSGDFYDLDYAFKWIRVMESNPDVKFYSYTKMVPMFQRLMEMGSIPSNFTLIFSEGGTLDELIGINFRHARVFGSAEELQRAGYDDASKDDTVAFESLTGRIGLVYHGYKSKAWTTGGAA